MPVDAWLDPDFEEHFLKRLAAIALARAYDANEENRAVGLARIPARCSPSEVKTRWIRNYWTGYSGLPGQQGTADLR